MATIAFQPPGLAGSSSGAAQTASSWSRASAGSIATIGMWVRSSRSPRSIFATRSASSITWSGNSCGMPCLWIAIRLKLRGANGSPSTVSTRAARRGGRPTFSARTRSPTCGLAELGDRQLAPFLLLDRAQPVVGALPVDDAEDELAALEQLLHRVGEPALPALLGAREDAVADAQSARPRPCAPCTRRRGGGPSASQRSGTAQARPAIVDVDDPQHRHLGHAAHLVEGAAGRRNRSAPRRPCRAAAS